MDRTGIVTGSHPGWCTNLVQAGSVARGERVLVIHVGMIFSGPEVEADGRRIELPA